MTSNVIDLFAGEPVPIDTFFPDVVLYDIPPGVLEEFEQNLIQENRNDRHNPTTR